MSNHRAETTLQEQLSELFGSYKAEWLRGRIFDLFTQPTYFPELLTTRSCLLVGGRGTGKTTVLRALSYEGQFALARQDKAVIRDWQRFGLYYRVDTNHVTAFSGPELPSDQWAALFAHYINMLLCEQILDFLQWYEFHTRGVLTLPKDACRRLATSLHLPESGSHRSIRDALIDAKIAFEAYINNVVDAPRPPLSLQSAPVNLLAEAVLADDQFRGKQFFFLIDEYENFLDLQQQVVNTLVKHAGELYCFKIGVRDLGRRCRSTLNENEQLISPADYALINIAEKLKGQVFDDFALSVCGNRIGHLTVPGQELPRDLRLAFAGLTDDAESQALGIESLVAPVRASLEASCGPSELNELARLSPLELYFIDFWATAQSQPMYDILKEALADPGDWATRFGNYKHSLLYTIRRGKRGIRKYYSGWTTLTQLAAGNIRYVLELVDQSLLTHLQEGMSLSSSISPEIQTKAAQRVGGMNLSELEGLAVDGAQLTRFLLSLGRIFQVMAANPMRHAPEVNQFEVGEQTNASDRHDLIDVERILNSAVMHLALLRSPGNKLGDVGDTRDYDYAIHPIFSALFEFSPRRKRKMRLSPQDIVNLIRRPKVTIRKILAEQNRLDLPDLPEQLTLFERFYNAET